MAPQTEDIVGPSLSKDSNVPEDLRLTSGFVHYPKHRDRMVKTSELWIKGKKEVDGVHPYWRVHHKLYDLSQFIQKHPGGSFWIEQTKGTDITELFESSHFGPLPDKLLAKYYVKEATTPRNSPYTFHEEGFYETLKRKVTPILKKEGTGPTKDMLLIQDFLLFMFLLTFFLCGWFSSVILCIISGVLLNCAVTVSHNFFHQKDNWRMYIWDLMLFSSKHWRISHALSHHPFPNTIYDYEISALEPFLQLFPRSSKTFLERYGVIFTSQLVYGLDFFIDLLNRVILFCKREGSIYLEDSFIGIQLVALAMLTGSLWSGLSFWLILHTTANVSFTLVGIAAAHHHPDIYHEGDALTEERDWGLHQVIATREKGEIVMSSLFLISISFGNHTLHHLFPTVDHSKLFLLMPAFLETCKEFGVKFELLSFWKHLVGLYAILAKNTPNPNTPKCLKST